jgi:PTH1 family peptidyl-tRNA hydrolase
MAKGDDAGFLNKIALATGTSAPKPDKPAKTPKRMHIRLAASPRAPANRTSARPAIGATESSLPASGPMADMLKKLFGNKD